MGNLWLDVRYGMRTLRGHRGFTVAVIAVLALGIGANTAVFSVAYSVLLKPLPYKEPARLVVALHDGIAPVSPADFLDYRAQVTAFEHLGAAQAWSGILAGSDTPEMVQGLQVTPDVLAMLGVEPELGRLFRMSEDDPTAAERVLLIGYSLWQRRFAGNPQIVGQTVRVGDRNYLVVGVMPAGFRFAPFWQTAAEMWTPLVLTERGRLHDRSGRSLRLFGRLAPGVSVAQAQAQMTAVARRLAVAYPQTNADVDITVVPLHERVVGSVRGTLLLLVVTVAVVLLIACADIANLLLTRAATRQREIAVRLALGVTRAGLVRQLAVESLLLSAGGGLVGLLLARGGLGALALLLPAARLPRQGEVGMDAAVFAFAGVLSVACGLVSGLVPALSASRLDVNERLKDGGRGLAGSTGGRRSQRTLVAVQVALALVLLVCAGLTLRTLHQLGVVNAGFNPHAVLAFDISAPASYDVAARMTLFDRVQAELAALPGVQAVGAINHLPIGGDVWTLGYDVPGRPAPPPGHGFSAVYRVVRPGYFDAMQIRILRGRGLTVHDDMSAPDVVVVNEALARRHWRGDDPIGRQIALNGVSEGPPVRLTVVGVAKNARQSDWTSEPHDEVYVPYLQRPGAFGLTTMTFVARTAMAPASAARVVHERLRAIDPAVPLSRIEPMEQVIADALWRSRLSAFLLAAFGALALLLAVVGIYGVMAYAARRRTQEIGVRLALGASRLGILRLVLREGLPPLAIGIGVGTLGALAASRLVASELYRVAPTDPFTFAAGIACLAVTGLLAAAVPAWRAASGDPLTALRDE